MESIWGLCDIPCLQMSGPIRKYMCSHDSPVSPSLKDTRGNSGQFPASPMSVISLGVLSPQLHRTAPDSMKIE